MAIKELDADLNIISKLGDNPGVGDGLTPAGLKAKFDEAAKIIKDYLNNYLVHEINKIVDVDYLLEDFLDATLYKSDKAANAKAVGDALRGLRSFYEKVIHSGDYVLASGGSFSARDIGGLTVRISGGEGVMMGNLFSLNAGTAEDIVLADGTYGLFRNDLIVVRCTKDDMGALSYSLDSVTGTQTSGKPVDPEYAQDDINADGILREFPLYRVRINGLEITELVPLFDEEKTFDLYIKEYVNASHFSPDNVTLPVSSWEGEAPPYAQTVAVEGILHTDNPHYGVVYSADQETRLAEKEAFALVDRLETKDGSVIFTCFEEKPGVDLVIQMEVNR